ncbi:MAG: tripartite tricarboxylate transporter permease [Aestuariivirga sp.]
MSVLEASSSVFVTAAVLAPLTSLFTLKMLWLLLFGTAIGLFFGVLPGLGGKLGLVFLIPFTFGMDPLQGAVFLLAMHSVVHTSGGFPSILFGVPGTGPDAATIVDGYPMAKNGEAGRALGATLAASAVGGIIGALYLSILIPFGKPLILAFGPGEYFMFAFFGITFIAALSGKSFVKGLAVGLFGLLISTVRLDPLTGEERFTFGQLFLWDGIDTVTAVMAIFAIPEFLFFNRRDGAKGSSAIVPPDFAGLLEGCKDVFRHWSLTLRTSLIGAFIGTIPGLGGDVATWICYGHAAHTSKTPELFGKGAIEGVIAPETANNSKEGGALLPTLLFGLPGSASMAILVGGLVALGIQPGPAILADGGKIVWVLVWTLALSNVIAALAMLATAPLFGKLASLRSEFLLPSIAVLSIAGSYMAGGAWQNLIVFLVLGVVGILLKLADWPRAPFAIGIVLGPIAETSLDKALAIWGPAFLLRPWCLALLALSAAAAFSTLYRHRKTGWT